MITTKISDLLFPQANSATLSGENSGLHPQLMRWDRTPGPGKVKVFTTGSLHLAITDQSEKKIAWLLETPETADYSGGVPKGVFSVVLSHSKYLIDDNKDFYFFPFGGSWIADWGMFEDYKQEMVSMIVGGKTKTSGHKMRHVVAEKYGPGCVHRFGQPYTPRFSTKAIPLRYYRYSIVIENAKVDFWFTEKLIDCISQGTVPIYWGCPSIGSFFNMDGIITFDDAQDLEDILRRIGKGDYDSRRDALVENLSLAKQYRCAEDWIVSNYPEIFK